MAEKYSQLLGYKGDWFPEPNFASSSTQNWLQLPHYIFHFGGTTHDLSHTGNQGWKDNGVNSHFSAWMLLYQWQQKNKCYCKQQSVIFANIAWKYFLLKVTLSAHTAAEKDRFGKIYGKMQL